MSASNYIKGKLTCNDARIGLYNVLKFTDSAHDFERVFIFYDDQESPYVDHVNKLKLLQEKIKFKDKDADLLNKIKNSMITKHQNQVDESVLK